MSELAFFMFLFGEPENVSPFRTALDSDMVDGRRSQMPPFVLLFSDKSDLLIWSSNKPCSFQDVRTLVCQVQRFQVKPYLQKSPASRQPIFG